MSSRDSQTGVLDMGTGRAEPHVSSSRRIDSSYLLAWMEFRDRSTHAVREREVLYRLIVR